LGIRTGKKGRGVAMAREEKKKEGTAGNEFCHQGDKKTGYRISLSLPKFYHGKERQGNSVTMYCEARKKEIEVLIRQDGFALGMQKVGGGLSQDMFENNCLHSPQRKKKKGRNAVDRRWKKSDPKQILSLTGRAEA